MSQLIYALNDGNGGVFTIYSYSFREKEKIIENNKS